MPLLSCHHSQDPKNISHSQKFLVVVQLRPTLCSSMDCSTPAFPVFHHLLEFSQIHVHWVGDVIQPSHPLPSLSSPTSNLSQHQGLFQWVGLFESGGQVLELQLQHQSFQWIFRVDFLSDWLDFISLLSKGLFKESCPAPWFEGISSSVLRIHLHCGRPGFDTWFGKIPWKRESLPTPVFWPGEFRELYSP